MVLGISDFLSEFLRRSSHVWFLAGIVMSLSNRYTVLRKVQFNLVTGLTLIETDSDLASAKAGAFHVVLVNSG